MPWKIEPCFENPKYDHAYELLTDLSALSTLEKAHFRLHGTAIASQYAPLRYRQSINRSRLPEYPDLIQGHSSYSMFCSSRLKALISSFQSDGLQFVPIEIERSDGQPGPAGYSLLKVVQLVDALDEANSEVKRQYDSSGEFHRFDSPIGAKYTFSAAKLGCAHLWVNRFLLSDVFISDPLRAEMMRSQMTGISTSQVFRSS